MSTLKSSAEDLTLNADGSGNDVIIQSNGSTKAIVTAEGQVGIGTGSPDALGAGGLHLFRGDSSAATYVAAGLVLEASNSSNWIQFKNPTTQNAGLVWSDPEAVENGYLYYNNNTDTMTMSVGSTLLLGGGDIVFTTAGKGIVLGSTTNVDANTLDDYEEGTWTPVYTASGGSAGGSFSNSENEGHYTKIGRLVNCKFKYTLVNNGDWTGSVIFTGLPFACDGDSPHVGSVTLNNCNFTGSWASMRIPNGASTTSIIMTNDNASVADLQASMVDNDAAIRGSFQYHTTS